MTATPLEQFLTQESDPDEADDYPELQEGISDPLASIAESLRTLASCAIVKLDGEDAAAQEVSDYSRLKAEYDELEALHDAKQALIEQVLEICKPSTSKLADKIRAVLEPPVELPKPAEPGDQLHYPGMDRPDGGGEVGPPAADADVEDWRGYARRKGYQGPDVDTANRSQIRTMLGIAHEGGGQ